MSNFLDSNEKSMCFGCEACSQVCPKNAITMVEDEEGFRYPIIDDKKCINCGMCRRICPHENMPQGNSKDKYVFGGYNLDSNIRDKSTSGGAFSAIVEAYCDENYVIFGAKADGLKVAHSYIDDKKDLDVFRKSKYSQSNINNTYIKVKEELLKGKKVLFSGTPCHIVGLKTFLQKTDTKNLLTVEVVCEGVPSPLYIDKLNQKLLKKYNSEMEELDYRYTDMKKEHHGKWDFQVMKIKLKNGKVIKKDRWFNPYWQIWLNHFMSRPSCYKCPFTNTSRNADITLGDLWGVHLYCPELYGHNGGSSLIIANTSKGKKVVKEAEKYMYGHELNFEDALKYQGPLKKSISENEHREEFMNDLENPNLDYDYIIKKWYKKPSIKLLYQKYIWGNRQKIFVWNLTHKKKGDNK